MENEYNTGMGTTAGMWEYLSSLLTECGEELPESLNEAIYALRDGKAMVILKNLVAPISTNVL